MAVIWPAPIAADPKTGIPTSLLWTIVILTGVLLLAAGIIVVLGRWAKKPTGQASDAGGELSLFRSLYESGECSKEEYEQIKNKLGKRIRKELKVPERQPEDSPQPEQPAASEGVQAEPPAAPDDRNQGFNS